MLSFPVFIVAVACTVVIADALGRRGLQRLGPLLALESSLLVLATLLPIAIGLPVSADDAAALMVPAALCGVLAHRLSRPSSP